MSSTPPRPQKKPRFGSQASARMITVVEERIRELGNGGYLASTEPSSRSSDAAESAPGGTVKLLSSRMRGTANYIVVEMLY